MAAFGVGMLKNALDEGIKGLKHKDNVRENIIPVNDDISETFDIHVETPEVLILKIQRRGKINLSLVRPGTFTGCAVEGTMNHFAQQQLVYKRSYRSDKTGYQKDFLVNYGDIFSIAMEARHLGSAVSGKGSTGMDATLQCSISYISGY